MDKEPGFRHKKVPSRPSSRRCQLRVEFDSIESAKEWFRECRSMSGARLPLETGLRPFDPQLDKVGVLPHVVVVGVRRGSRHWIEAPPETVREPG